MYTNRDEKTIGENIGGHGGLGIGKVRPNNFLRIRTNNKNSKEEISTVNLEFSILNLHPNSSQTIDHGFADR